MLDWWRKDWMVFAGIWNCDQQRISWWNWWIDSVEKIGFSLELTWRRSIRRSHCQLRKVSLAWSKEGRDQCANIFLEQGSRANGDEQAPSVPVECSIPTSVLASLGLGWGKRERRKCWRTHYTLDSMQLVELWKARSLSENVFAITDGIN